MSLLGKLISNYRFRAVLVLAGVVALLAFAASLDPDRLEAHNSGYRLLPPCGILVQTGYPCPTCYMSRSFAYMMHGRPDKAFAAQIFGALLCVLVIYLGFGALHVLISGKPWKPFWHKWRRRYTLGLLVLLFFGAWIFKLIYGTFISHEFPVR